MAKSTYITLVTPKGRAVYPHLSTPDTKFNPDGVYRVKLAVKTAEAEALLKSLDEVLKKGLEQAMKENPKKKIKEANTPWDTNPDDDSETLLSFKSNARIKVKGEMVSIRPALFDAKGKPLAKGINIGGGSILRVSFEAVPFYGAAIGAGVSLRLKAVQVIELKTYGDRGATGFGFQEEDGYETSTSEAADEPGAEKEPEAGESLPEAKSDGSDF